ncbi:MmgE/PrpD family protein [Sphingomonas sp. IC-56]|uniref:MmgE/PrpD family protein n=1 Tax=Sphingomonas sp. IC-56 TaxID=2898529 RepID=UPI001E4B547B|nr:MmgE/PrpD family protein [Sphingomonas sp. IC-56]MCD2322874.1 MmgE/PrpD family protein [Sphingomonas sp. IC-56]
MFSDETNRGLSARVATHVACVSYDQLEETTRDATRRALLDALGVTLAATGLAAEALPYRNLALAQGAGPSRVLGIDTCTNPVAAALANGALAHAMDFGDAFDPGAAHPNAALVPALLALSDADPRIDGGRFLAAMTAGSDLACRLSIAPARTYEEGGWYPPALVGLIASAAACAKLIGLDAKGICDAMGLAMLSASFPGEIKYDPGSPLRGVREAFAARGAVEAALLAQADARAFAEPLEGRAGFFAIYGGGGPTDALTADLGTRFLGDEVSFKPWPCCRGTHAYIEAALELRQRCDWREIVRAEAEIGPVQEMLIRPHSAKAAPENSIQAKFSIPFTTAHALVHGSVSLDSFGDAARADSPVLELAQRVVERRNPAWGREHAASGSLTLILRSGERLERQVPQAAGHPGNPLSNTALIDKFILCASRAAIPLDSGRAAAAAARILALGPGVSASSLLRMEHKTSDTRLQPSSD